MFNFNLVKVVLRIINYKSDYNFELSNKKTTSYQTTKMEIDERVLPTLQTKARLTIYSFLEDKEYIQKIRSLSWSERKLTQNSDVSN